MAGNDANTVLLLHCDGTNGSTTVTDSAIGGAAPHTISLVGTGAQISTAQAKFGTASILTDPFTASCFHGDGSSDFAFGTGDFTIDLCLYTTFSGLNLGIYDGRPAAANTIAPWIALQADNTVLYVVNNGNKITGTTPLTLSAWNHVALARASGTTKMFLNGVQEGSDYVASDNMVSGTDVPGLPGTTTGSNAFRGYWDELRVSKGIARWTANFTPPTVAYSAVAGGFFARHYYDMARAS